MLNVTAAIYWNGKIVPPFGQSTYKYPTFTPFFRKVLITQDATIRLLSRIAIPLSISSYAHVIIAYRTQIVVVSDAKRAGPILEERGWVVEPLEIEY